jgi:hypothetical protein
VRDLAGPLASERGDHGGSPAILRRLRRASGRGDAGGPAPTFPHRVGKYYDPKRQPAGFTVTARSTSISGFGSTHAARVSRPAPGPRSAARLKAEARRKRDAETLAVVDGIERLCGIRRKRLETTWARHQNRWDNDQAAARGARIESEALAAKAKITREYTSTSSRRTGMTQPWASCNGWRGHSVSRCPSS